MYGLNAYKNLDEKLTDIVSTSDGRLFSEYSTTDSFKSLSVRINFIDTWLKVLESNFSCRCCAYSYNMKEL